jgi:hypothetical protein
VEDIEDIEVDDTEDNFKALENKEEGENGDKPDSPMPDAPTRTSFGEKKDDNENDEDDEVNVDEDDTEEGSKVLNQPKISITVHKKPVPPPVEYDYTLLDELFGLLDEDEIEPISCGYLNKIVQSLLSKIKTKLMNYLLLKKDG